MGKVLVYCEDGISQLPNTYMAYLMKNRQLHLMEASDDIKQTRSVISPNFSVLGQFPPHKSEILPFTPTRRPSPTEGKTVGSSFMAHLQTLSPGGQGSY